MSSALQVGPVVRRLHSQGIPGSSSILQSRSDLDPILSQDQPHKSGRKSVDKADNRTQDGTVAQRSNDMWRRHPDLQAILEELEAITNKNIENPDVTRRLVDWFYT